MKKQVKKAFKCYSILSQKSNKKADRLCMKFSSTERNFAEVPQFPISKSTPSFFYLQFFEECVNPKVRINKMVNKYNVNYPLVLQD